MENKTQNELFNQYIITGDYGIRTKIIEKNMGLVPYVTYKYAMATGMKREELNSYGYEGLLIAVDKYNPDLGYSFSTFAVSYIINYTRRAVRDIRGFNTAKQYYSDFRKCYNTIMDEYDDGSDKKVSVYDDSNIVNDIVELMIKEGFIDSKEKEAIMNKVNIVYPESYDEQDALVSDFDLEKTVFDKILKDILDEMLHELTPRQEKIIRERYGFNDGNAKTYDEIGKMENVSGSRIHQIEKSALKKLKHPRRKKRIREFYY